MNELFLQQNLVVIYMQMEEYSCLRKARYNITDVKEED